MNKVGLVLEGGGMRGLYTAGILDFFMEKDLFKMFVKRSYLNYPKLVDTIFNRYKIYNDTLDYIEELEKKDKAFVIRPSKPLKVDRLEKNPQKLKKLYEIGYGDAKNLYFKMKEWIGQRI